MGEYTITINGESETEELVFEDNTFYFEYTEIDPINQTTITFKEVYIKN